MDVGLLDALQDGRGGVEGTTEVGGAGGQDQGGVDAGHVEGKHLEQ